MHEFITLIAKIYPLYILVACGYLAGRYFKADRHTISSLLIYFIAPIVVFNGVATAPRTNAYLLLPFIFLTVACVLSLIFYEIGGLFWRGSERNLLSFIAGTGNTGYFGIPLILALFGQAGLSIAVYSTLGLIIYESTRGYYVIAKSNATAVESVKKVIKLPVLYAFLAGLLCNRLGISLPASVQSMVSYCNGAYTVLGMMILGVVLASATRTTFDRRFTLVSFTAKFLAYPASMALVVFFDSNYFNLFSGTVHHIMLLLSVAPIASNTVTYASYLKAHPEKAALTVALSTIFALAYIPLFVIIFLK